MILPMEIVGNRADASLVPSDLLDPVVAYFHPRRVIVFGSAARGDAGPDSDIDLLVVLDDDAPADKLTLKAGYEARQSYRLPADVVPCREETFRRKSRIVGTLAYAASHEGVVVYERQ
jgi:predicted nucleotidyltransferase